MTTTEKIATLQCYIKIRKNVDIAIYLRNQADLPLLDRAFLIADKWLKAHNAIIRRL